MSSHCKFSDDRRVSGICRRFTSLDANDQLVSCASTSVFTHKVYDWGCYLNMLNLRVKYDDIFMSGLGYMYYSLKGIYLFYQRNSLAFIYYSLKGIHVFIIWFTKGIQHYQGNHSL